MSRVKVISIIFSLVFHIFLLYLWLPVKELKPPIEVENELNFINAVVVSQSEIDVKTVKNVEPPKEKKQPELIQNQVKDVISQEILPTESKLISPIEDLDFIPEDDRKVDENDKNLDIKPVQDEASPKNYIPFYKVDKRPQFFKKAELLYPEIAKTKRVEGRVILEVDIDEYGNVKNCRVIKRVGFGLEEAAIEMINHSSFIPAYSKSRPVPVRMRFTINFELD